MVSHLKKCQFGNKSNFNFPYLTNYKFDQNLTSYKRMASSQYSITKHTILPLIFKIAHKSTLSYLLKDPKTSSLVLLPSSEEPESIKYHVQNIQKQFKCKLTHTFLHNNQRSQQIFDEKIITPEKQGQLKPQLIGDLSFCFIGAQGYQKDFNLIAATHITPVSTKFAVLFTGQALSVCSVDIHSQAKSQDYMQTLNKLKYFPNETLLFPSRKVMLDDLQFVYGLEKNDFVKNKIDQFKEKSKQFADCLIPTSILEQKNMNPFLNPQKYASILKSNDKALCFEALRKIRKQWRKI